MQIKKKDVNKNLTIFLFAHLIIWTLVPTFSNLNLPLDTIEHLAWATDLQFGYGKHPPVVAWVSEIFYQIFSNQDWAYYFLSQLFVVLTFFIIFKFSSDFLGNSVNSLISIFLLEGIFFYNFTSPEFNVNVCQLPFWALSVMYCWKGLKNNNNLDWLLFGLFAALGVLSKYLFIYLLAAIDIFFVYLLLKKKINLKCLISLISFFIVLAPHIIWLVDNNYTTFKYALHRTELSQIQILDHFLNPIIFLGKQFGILIPFIAMCYFIVSKFSTKFNFKDKKLLFLLTINIIPIILMFLTSFLMGVKIRTMWMTPFYLFFGVLVIYIYQSQINLKKLKVFTVAFLILFIFSPFVYAYVSITQTDKRTDYNGKEHAKVVQEYWDNQKTNLPINVVLGDEWIAGNLSYHLKSRPVWEGFLEDDENFYGLKKFKHYICGVEFCYGNK